MALDKFVLPPEQATYVYKLGEEVLVAELDGGFSRSRRNIDRAAAIVECTWVFGREQYQYFRSFYNIRTQRGVVPFLMDLLLDQPYLTEHECKFIPDSVVLSQPLGLSFLQTAHLEVKRVVPNEAFDNLVVIQYTNRFINPLERLANYQLPEA